MTRILVVQDNRSQACVLQAFLEMAGFEVVVAASGSQALECFRDSRFNVVISDGDMSAMTGFELCRQIKNTDGGLDVPVILLTALDKPQEILKSLECGADNFISKSCEPEYMLSRIAGILDRRMVSASPADDDAVVVSLAEQEFAICSGKQHLLRFLVSALDDYAHARQREEQANLRLIKQRQEAEARRFRERESGLEEAARTKLEFLATMSHELRSPLNAVINFSEGLLQRVDRHPLDEHQQDRLTRIQGNGRHMLTLINDFLDITKVEAGKMQLDNSLFNPEQLARELGGLPEAIIRDKPEVKYQLVVEPDLPLINSDQNKIRQILINLLSNAGKFTEKGTVTLSIRRDGESILFCVEDTGVGIPEEQLEHVFDKFYQIGQVKTPSIKGTGLGLSICKCVGDLLGGELTVRSQVGQGSTFTLSLPLEPRGMHDEQADAVTTTASGRSTRLKPSGTM